MDLGPQWPGWLLLAVGVVMAAGLYLAARRHGSTARTAPVALLGLALWLAIAIVPWARLDQICMATSPFLDFLLEGCTSEWQYAPTDVPRVAWYILVGGAWFAVRTYGWLFVFAFARRASQRRRGA